jgi:hypothetical protein
MYSQNIINALHVLMMIDIRLQVHTLTEKKGRYVHNKKKCPLCQANEIIRLNNK